jgi:quaternary ammonium compound-resistance protein SugE
LEWVALVFAGVFEVIWATAMKQSNGFSRLIPSIITIIGMTVSFVLLAWSMRILPLGTTYTIWTGIGAIGTFLIGIYMFGEEANPMRILSALLIVGGLIMMKLSTP